MCCSCVFHLDINTQQTYWPGEVANLSECHEPLFRLVESLLEPERRTARDLYGARGWVCHVFTNAWGYIAPGWGLGWGLHPTGGIGIATHLAQRWECSGDRSFLERRAYPVLREAAVPVVSWFRGLTLSRQIRYAAIALLAVWVGGIGMPLAVLGALADSAPAPNPAVAMRRDAPARRIANPVAICRATVTHSDCAD